MAVNTGNYDMKYIYISTFQINITNKILHKSERIYIWNNLTAWLIALSKYEKQKKLKKKEGKLNFTNT